jgi:Zn-dependent alcohol dehydrogenase
MRTRAAVIREPGKPWKLTEINQGYQDLDDGKLIRGVIIHGG